MPNRNSANVRVFGSLDDMLWLAPVGTTMPTTLDLTLPAPWVPAGWLAEAGVPVNVSTDVEKFKAYQGGTTIRTKVTATEKSLSWTMLEKTPLALRLHQGAADPYKISSTVARVNLPQNIGVVSMAAVLVTKDDGIIDFLCMEKVEIGEREAVPHSNNEMSSYGMSAEIVGESYMLTNAPAFTDGLTYTAPV